MIRLAGDQTKTTELYLSPIVRHNMKGQIYLSYITLSNYVDVLIINYVEIIIF